MPVSWAEIPDGLAVTLGVFGVSACATVVWALVIVCLRLSPIRLLRILGTAYIEVFRSTPLLVQLLIVFAVLPTLIGVVLPPFHAAVLAFTLNASGYLAETYRSGLQAVPVGQREVARALGMGWLLEMRRVVVPLAIRVVIPGLGNVLAMLLLMTPFAYIAGLEDVMAKANQAINRTGDFSAYAAVCLFYVVVGLGVVYTNHRLSRAIGGATL